MQSSSNNRSPFSTADEREVANSLLELSRKGHDCVPLPVAQPQAPKKRGRKPKKKKVTPLLMKQSKKALSNYAKFLEKPKDCTSGLKAAVSHFLTDASTSANIQNTPTLVALLENQPDKKINKIKLVKVQDGASWLSQVVQSAEEPHAPNCNELTQDNTPEALLVAEASPVAEVLLVAEASPVAEVLQVAEASPVAEVLQVAHKSSIASLPTSWLPFKKRKLSTACSLEVPQNNSVTTLEKTPEKVIAKPRLQSSGSKTPPESKTSISEQICVVAGTPKKDKVTQDDIQVVYESPPSVSTSPVSLVVKKVTLPAVDEIEMNKSADHKCIEKQQTPPLASNQLPEIASTVARKKNPVAMVVRPIIYMPYPPSVLPELFKHYSHLNQTERFAVIGAKFQDSQMVKASVPQLPVRVEYRILSDSWPLQPKLSVYEIQPVQIVGMSPQSLVTTFVLLHKQRSETKSLHYLNRFPGLCDVRFEYQPKMQQQLLPHGREQVPLPVHILFQQIADEHMLNKADLAGLRVQFPNSTFCTVVEDHRKVVNKIAVIYIDEETGCAHVKTYAFTTAVAASSQTSCQTSDTVFDSWFSKMAGTLEVFRLTIPAWMFFSREVIRLHRLM